MLAVLCLAGCSSPVVTLGRPSPSAVSPSSTTPNGAATASVAARQAIPVDTATASAERPTETPRIGLTPSATESPPAEPTASVASQLAYSAAVQVAEPGGVAQAISMKYLLYVPSGYGQNPNERWPLILFLHGSEERGGDPEVLRKAALPQSLDRGLGLPALVLSPQCPLGKRWWQRTEQLGALLDHIESRYAVDNERVYLTGFSMGAYGAWALALRFPERFAAMVPVAGGCDFRDNSIPADMCNLKDLPVWVLHGAQDGTIAPRESENAVNALRACGGNVQFTLYPNADHTGACELAYADCALYDWLFSRLRKSSETSEVWTTKHTEG
jgi:predicted peptidase